MNTVVKNSKWTVYTFLFFMVFFPIVSEASNSPIGEAGKVNISALPYEHIAVLFNKPNENEQIFLFHIAPQLRGYSDKTGFEACGVIATDGHGKYAVILGSNHSHIGCVNDPKKVPNGMISTGETIHSHGRPGLRVPATESDWILMGNPFNPPHFIGGFDLYHFSDQDYQNPGYLATPNGLLYQNGKNKEKIINP